MILFIYVKKSSEGTSDLQANSDSKSRYGRINMRVMTFQSQF